MPRCILIDEFHITVYAPRGWPTTKYDLVRRTLDDAVFTTAVRKALRTVKRQFAALEKVRLTLTR